MNYHKLLQKQIKKYLTVECAENPLFSAFIQSVNESYLAFERDKGIMDHTFNESEKEYHQINDQLKKEIELKQLATTNLYKSINKEDLEYDIKYDHHDDLLFVSEYLRAQINRRKEIEEHLHQNNQLLKTLLSNFQSGILAEDENHKIIFANQLYCDMRNIKLAPEEMVGIDSSKLIQKAKLVFKNPQHFIEKTDKILRHKKLILGELLETADNHYIERDYIPIFIDNEYKGHLWKYTDVTTKIQTLELLRQSDEHNRLIMNSSLNSIITINSNNRQITFWNSQAEQLFGWSEKEALGKNLIDLIIPLRYKNKWNTAVNHYLKKGEDSYFNRQLEIVLVNKAGEKFFGEASIIPIIQNGETFFCAFIQDISKRKEAEKNLLQTVELLKILLANLQSGVLVEDENRKILFTNQLFCDIFSIPVNPETMIGIDCTNSAEQAKQLFKDVESFGPRINTILKGRISVTDELLETFDNRFLVRDYVPIFINDEYKGHLWKYTDVTQRIQNQKLLEQSEQRNSLIMNSSLNAIINVDDQGIITFWNRQATLVFGWESDEIIGKLLVETILPNQNATIFESKRTNSIKKIENASFKKNIELIGIKKTGEALTIDCSIVPIIQNEKTFFCLFIHDITEKKEAETLRKIQEEKYQNVIAHMNLGLLEVDTNEIIQYVNQSFASMSGYEINELIGTKTSDIFAFEQNFEMINAKKELRKKGTSDIYQFPTKNKNGEPKWWAISGAPNYDNKGNIIGSIGIHLDITEQKQLEIDLEKEKTKALESSKAKEVFLANMSHEIRTPLNAIIGFLRELDKQELTEIQKKYIFNSSIASKHLLAIINNILDISKIEAGEMSLESEDFIFEKSISNVATVLQPTLEQKGLDINITISKKIEKVLIGDALRLQQILFNLIGNAIKFTNNGSISINCEVVEDSLTTQLLQISVTDTGIGMESSFIKNIFNKFSQEDKATTRKYGGTGLGLSITNELVKLMGGRIEIESKKNVGTTFNIYLNFPKASNQFIEDIDTEQPLSRIDNISILLVEDNYLNRMVAQNSLQYYNCKVTEAENGVEAIEVLKNNRFDIILMDIQMPEMGGIEATEIIRNTLQLTTPIIALTANAFKTEIDKCKKAGMDDYVTKPFDEDILIETIAKHTTNKKIAIPHTANLEISATDSLYNLSSLNNLSRGNREFILKMVAVFIEQTSEVIEKGTLAISQNNFIEVSRLIHKIKPSVESLGITSIISELQLLEKIAKEAKDKEQITALFSLIKEVLEKAMLQLKENEIKE
jgi:PAS domain S-box-containing protein